LRNANNEGKKKALKVQFSYDDITNLLFNNQFPKYETYPFKKWKHSLLRNIPVAFEIRHSDRSNIAPKNLLSAKIYLNHNLLKTPSLLSLPPVVFYYLVDAYAEVHTIWQEYFYENISEYCKNPFSIVKWNEVKYNGIPGKRTVEKAIWVTTCATKDREFWMDFAISMRESLLGWLNPKMYEVYQQKKEKTRYNVKYDEFRLAMAEGRIKDLDGKLPDDILEPVDENSFSNEDYDIVK
jgi:hypothetical protein